MRSRIIAALDLALILPAALFMLALIVRNLNPLPYEPARTAEQLVQWYSHRMWTLWLLLLALPFTVLVTGFATLRDQWSSIRANIATLFVAATTLAAAGILVIVVLHMAAN